MVPGILLFLGKCFPVPVLRDVKFTSNDGFYLQWTIFVIRIGMVFVRFRNKLEDTKHVTMVRNGQSGHVIIDGLFVQGANACCTIQQRILGMNV
jgi:hypothetical protein